MSKITSIKNYLTKPSKCYIPKCKAKCCINAPLPEGFLPSHADKIQREIYGAFNMGQNDIRDTYNSIIYSTRPITFIGYDIEGKALYGITKETMEKYQLKSMQDIQEFINYFDDNKFYNYCPFIDVYARCSVYESRPPICKEFGTMPGDLNVCPEKASLLEIFKSKTSELFDFRATFNRFKNFFSRKTPKTG